MEDGDDRGHPVHPFESEGDIDEHADQRRERDRDGALSQFLPDLRADDLGADHRRIAGEEALRQPLQQSRGDALESAQIREVTQQASLLAIPILDDGFRISRVFELGRGATRARDQAQRILGQKRFPQPIAADGVQIQFGRSFRRRIERVERGQNRTLLHVEFALGRSRLLSNLSLREADQDLVLDPADRIADRLNDDFARINPLLSERFAQAVLRRRRIFELHVHERAASEINAEVESAGEGRGPSEQEQDE
ncbi:hypothetical protein HRbin10_01267 [bacterium HR10]|nr:hypothetical protein HRbin10_01267 [bacterium HR10]